ncbi:MAG: SMC-Scp complex subunit ScpB [Alphaproteobacteria bacterium RIFOXYD12_FULL_60_8]|nr:MAG: SMC-Scp complex subunit ScpB [Alphaproteobacteria bacterium RIFOXYD12_FULL_60_8]
MDFESPSPSLDAEQMLRVLEALLFASDKPVEAAHLAERLPHGADVGSLLEELQRRYASHGVNLVQRGGKWALRTATDLASYLTVESEISRKLSRAALETLAIIAYHQPITRAEIEEIRGVALSKGTLDILFEAGWVHPKGRKRSPGRPVLWRTTEAFLDHFGLESADDLPGIEELKAAGLLDTRPALAAYGATAHDDGTLVDIDEDDDPRQLDLIEDALALEDEEDNAP